MMEGYLGQLENQIQVLSDRVAALEAIAGTAKAPPPWTPPPAPKHMEPAIDDESMADDESESESKSKAKKK